MALTLKTADAGRGAHWVRDGLRLYMKRPLAFTALFMMFMFAAIVAGALPFVGGIVQMMMVPLLSLGFMVASQSALLEQPVGPAQFVEPLRGAPAQRKSLLVLCLTYAALAIAVLWLSDLAAGGGFTKAMELMRRQGTPAEFDALMADRRLVTGTLVGTALLTAITVPFWHAPALVHWAHQGAAQALFSSTLAIWRCRGAFVVYSLTWLAMMGVFAVATALLFGILGLSQLAPLIALPAGLFFSTLFYVSLVFTFNDSFSSQ